MAAAPASAAGFHSHSGHDLGMSEDSGNSDLRRDVSAEQFALFADNVRASNLPTLLVGALYAAYYSHFTGLIEAWWWWGALALAVAWRWTLLPAARPLPASRLPLDLALAFSGLLWGGSPLLIVWLVGEGEVFTAILLAAGIAIAAFGSYGMDNRATLLVTVPIGISIVGVSLTTRDPAYYTIAVALPLLYIHQFFVIHRARHVLANQIKLRMENNLLVAELSAHAEKTSAELDRRMETERILRASRDRAERMSATDGLTGIANRRYFDKRLKSEVSRAFRDRTQLSVVISDIDYFKQFNDVYGHGKGDDCLKEFARILESYCRRGGDLAARIGGEEFALLLPTTEHGAAMKLAEQARAAFDDAAIEHSGSKVKGNTTASFGVSTMMPESLEAGEMLLRRADRALYRAKDKGRNCVISDAELADGEAAAG